MQFQRQKKSLSLQTAESIASIWHGVILPFGTSTIDKTDCHQSKRQNPNTKQLTVTKHVVFTLGLLRPMCIAILSIAGNRLLPTMIQLFFRKGTFHQSWLSHMFFHAFLVMKHCNDAVIWPWEATSKFNFLLISILNWMIALIVVDYRLHQLLTAFVFLICTYFDFS